MLTRLEYARRFLAVVLAFIVMGVAAAETRAPSTATPAKRAEHPLLPSTAGAWLLVLDSWGGFAGQGKGGVTITSDGKVFARRRGHQVGKKCRARLTEEEIQALTRAVSTAGRSNWSANYEPEKEKACCDWFTWSLQLHRREPDGAERVTRTAWHEASEGRPKDLLAVAFIAQGVMTSVLTSCEA